MIPECSTLVCAWCLSQTRILAQISLIKSPGFPIDLTVRAAIAVFVTTCLGHSRWPDAVGEELSIEGEGRMAIRLPVWLQLDKVLGHDYRPLVRHQEQC